MPKIIRRGAPNSKTPGVLGQEYLDKDTKKTYICTHVDVEPGDRSGETTATYTWTPEGSGGGGGVSSWNDIPDRPFGDVAIKVDTFEWDGNTEGLEYALTREPTKLYRVSDSVPTLDDIKNGLSIGRSWTGTAKNYTEEILLEYYESYGVITSSYDDFFIIPTDNYRIVYNGFIHTFPKAGVYLYEQKGEYFNYVTIPGYTGFENGSDTLTWDGNIDGLDNATTYHEPYFFYISDKVLTIDDVQNGVNIVMADDSVNNVPHDSLLEIYNATGIITDNFNSFCIAPSDNYVIVDEVFGATKLFPKAGLYVYSDSGYYIKSFKIPGCNIFDGVSVKQLDPKYIEGMYRTEFVPKMILPPTSISFGNSSQIKMPLLGLERGKTYKVHWNGVEYTCVCWDDSRNGNKAFAIGNGTIMNIGGKGDTGEPFCIYDSVDVHGECLFYNKEDGVNAATLVIERYEEVVTQIPSKYIKDMYYEDFEYEYKLTDYTFTTSDYSSHGVYSGTTVPYPNYITIGDVYDVVVDGVPYRFTATSGSSLPKYEDDFSLCPVYMHGESMGMVRFTTANPNETHTVSIRHVISKINTIPARFLPESVDCVVIRSSTEGSTKKFKLTVDDSGTVSATEVV